MNSQFSTTRINNTEQIKAIADNILKSINKRYSNINRPLRIMHICGTHEATVSRSGMRSLLPTGLEIIAGPGCPVCVAPAELIAKAIKLANDGHVIVTFGDMFKVPDHKLQTLAMARSNGLDIRVVYSVMDALSIALDNPSKKIVWLGVGFETTAPMTAHVILNNPPNNFYILSYFRLVPPAMEVLVNDPDQNLDGFILPGHVSTIIGSVPYNTFADKYKLPGVIAGFDPIDFLIAIDYILKQIQEGVSRIDNAYPQVVKENGNIQAINALKSAFNIVDARWRGIGVIPKSGYKLKEKYKEHDANLLLSEPITIKEDLTRGCRCGKVILGKVKPKECPHFLRKCTPEHALGPCMVSDEGTCRIAAIYPNLE